MSQRAANAEQLADERVQATADASNAREIVVRTDRGLSVAGTRITLYAILDYLHGGWSPKLVQEWLGLTDTQMAGVLAYLEAHHDEVQQEYQRVVRQAEENRNYWEERNRDRPARDSAAGAPETDGLRARLQAWKDKISQE